MQFIELVSTIIDTNITRRIFLKIQQPGTLKNVLVTFSTNIEKKIR